MIAAGLVPVLLAAALLLLSGLNLAHLPTSRKHRVVLFGVRVTLLAALVLAFVQPTLRFSRLGSSDDSALILIDNSRSMSLFRPDSAINVVRRGLLRSSTRATIAVFGDSLAAIPSLDGATFSELQTRFPAVLRKKAFTRQRKVLLVSDGNLRDAGAVQGGFEDRDCGYLILPAINPRPFLIAEAGSGSIESGADKAVSVPVQITGFAPHRRQILIESTTPGYAVHQVHALDSGYSADTVLVSIVSREPGRHLLTLRIGNAADSISTSCGLVHLVIPDTITTRLNAPAPDLDARFIALALRRAGTWKIVGAGQKPYDLFITFTLDASNDSLLAGLAPGGVVLAIGVLPCKDAVTLYNPVVSNLFGNESVSGFARLSGSLPPLASIARCPSVAAYEREEHALLARVTGPRATADTIPLLYEASFRNRPAIIMAGRGFWKWDFLPLAFSDTAIAANAFSSVVLSMVRNRLLMNLSNRFIMFPVDLPLLSTEPIAFSVSVPATITAPTQATIRIRFLGAGGTIFDTTQSIRVSGSAPTGVSVAAQKPGRYLVEATLSAGGLEATSRDSLTVENDNAELRAVQQNSTLLDGWGRPVALTDSAVAAFLAAPSTTGRETATEFTELPLRQSWWLLGCIGAILALEWMLRRRWMAD